MKHVHTILLFTSLLALASCSSGQASSTDSIDPSYKISWVSPKGIPTIAFYDQGANQNWQSFAKADEVAKGFLSDNVDAIVFDGYAGLNNIKNNNRNYVLARWISGGTFYLVSTKHSSLADYEVGQTVKAFVKTGNAAQAFLSLAKNQWNWGDLSPEGSTVTWAGGVSEVKDTLESDDKAFDWYLIAQPVLFATKNVLQQKGVTLNVVSNLQTDWANAHNGAKIPAAALFLNKKRLAEHRANLLSFVSETETRIKTAIDNPDSVVKALNDFAATGGNVADTFGFGAPVVKTLQKDGANGFGLIDPTLGLDRKAIANDFARDLGTSTVFEDSLFL